MNNIKRFRVLAGLTQVELAKDLEISRTAVIKLETGQTKIASKDTTQKMCELFNTTPVMLYGLDNLTYLPINEEDIEYLVKEMRGIINNGN